MMQFLKRKKNRLGFSLKIFLKPDEFVYKIVVAAEFLDNYVDRQLNSFIDFLRFK